MITIILFLLGIAGLTNDLIKKRRGIIPLIWNNFSPFLMLTLLMNFVLILVMNIYQMEEITGVISKIQNNGYYGQIQILLLFGMPIIILTILAIGLMFIKLDYKKNKIKKLEK